MIILLTILLTASIAIALIMAAMLVYMRITGVRAISFSVERTEKRQAVRP